MHHTRAAELVPTILVGDATSKSLDSGSRFRLNRDVFLVTQDGVSRVLDLDRGQFYGLDPISTQLLTLVLETNPDHAVATIVSDFDVEPARVRRDLAELLGALTRKKVIVAPCRQGRSARVARRLATALRSGLTRATEVIVACLARSGASKVEPSGVSRMPGPWTVGLMLAASWLSLRLLGWSGTLAWWRRWHRETEALDGRDRAAAIEAVDRVVRAAASRKLVLPMVCKERALVGYQILRACFGLPATLVIGINRHPFQAHAWVTCGDQFVTDDAEHCRLFSPVAHYA